VVVASPVLAARRVAAPALPQRKASPALYRSVLFDPKINFVERATLQRTLLQHAPAKPVSSDKFSISFSYCMVKIQRPWYYEPFLFNKNWYIPSYKAGSFSTATADKNDGLFPAIPIALVVIKDLKITANWTDSDTQNAQNAMAFGPFSLAGSKFENNSLSCNGMQIIAWIFNVLPVLPANADPALSGVSTAAVAAAGTDPSSTSAAAAATSSGSSGGSSPAAATTSPPATPPSTTPSPSPAVAGPAASAGTASGAGSSSGSGSGTSSAA
jgi:hypothetical protein